MHYRLAGLAAAASLLTAGQALAYDYPVPEPFTATVIGTPVPQMRAKTSDVKLRTGHLRKTVEREIPKVL